MTLSFLLLCSQHFFPYLRWTTVQKRHCGIRCQVLLVSGITLRNKTKLSLYNARWACLPLSCISTTYPLNWRTLDIYTITTTLVPAGQICTTKIIRKCHYHFTQTPIINEDTSLPSDFCWPSLIQIPFLKWKKVDVVMSSLEQCLRNLASNCICPLGLLSILELLSHWISVFLHTV